MNILKQRNTGASWFECEPNSIQSDSGDSDSDQDIGNLNGASAKKLCPDLWSVCTGDAGKK